MPSFADSIFLFVLALLLFGPKKLPVLARELGKWMGEFRRASNEFKMQMEDELRAAEQADRQKKIAEMEAAAPVPPPLSDPEVPARYAETSASPDAEPQIVLEPVPAVAEAQQVAPAASDAPMEDDVRPVPIATSGSLKMMPPATGLPTPRHGRPGGTGLGVATDEQREEAGALGPLVDAIPEASSNGAQGPAVAAAETESLAHGD